MTFQTVDLLNKRPLPDLELYDYSPAIADFRSAVLAGLRQDRKTLPCKFFYDRRGSALFDQICQLDEYYPTRTELWITRRYATEIAAMIGPGCTLVEYGSGSSLKTRILLDHFERATGYVPIDISRAHLMQAAAELATAYPRLPVTPVCADYTAPFQLPREARRAPARTIAYFPGSTIGNFEPAEALAFLRGVRRLCGSGSGLLIGVDLKKDPVRLHRAYNDAAGVTASFNLNLLQRINCELGGGFDLDAFSHYAYYNPDAGRVEMHLVSRRRQSATAAGETFHFECGQSVHTESCYKYTLPQFGQLARAAGYSVRQVWVDEQQLFSLQFLTSGSNAAIADA